MGSEQDERKADIAIYGATSIVAGHIIFYIAQCSLSMKSSATGTATMKIVLAGWNGTKLRELRDAWTRKMSNLRTLRPDSTGTCAFDVAVADVADVGALRGLSERTRVMINCAAGPFAGRGTNVVGACAGTGCDYVDIAGDVAWASGMRERYGERSKNSGSRIVSFCGVDSIPSDIGVFAAVQALRNEEMYRTLEIKEATTWFSIQGGLNGGTLGTIASTPLNVRHCFSQEVPFLLDDPLALTHPKIRTDPSYQSNRNRMCMSEWLNQFSLVQFHSNFRWGASSPFYMAPINTKVVYASSIALKYGQQFRYYERLFPMGYVLTNHLGPISVIGTFMTHAFFLLGLMILKAPILGASLLARFQPPGTGDSDRTCSAGRTHLYAEATSVGDGRNGPVDRASCLLLFSGDPGNYVTAQCACEAAFALLLDREDLPPRSPDGFGTPAEVLGNVLLRRLKETPVRPVKIVTHVRRNVSKMEWQMYPDGAIMTTR